MPLSIKKTDQFIADFATVFRKTLNLFISTPEIITEQLRIKCLNILGDDEPELKFEIIPLENGLWKCLVCDQQCKGQYSAKRHFKFKHVENVPITCRLCTNVLKNIRSHYRHCRDVHGLTAEELRIDNFVA